MQLDLMGKLHYLNEVVYSDAKTHFFDLHNHAVIYVDESPDIQVMKILSPCGR